MAGPARAVARLSRLIFLGLVASLGGAISTLGDAGRRLRFWAQQQMENGRHG